MVCLPADHPLAGQAEVSPRELAEEPMIFFLARDMPGYVSEIRPVFAGLPFPRVRTRVVHQETALGFVAAGTGFTVLPESVSEFRPAAVRVARIAGDPKTVMCLALPEGELSPAAERFRAALRATRSG